MQLLTFFVIGPAIAVVIVYRAWRQKLQTINPKRYGIVCLASSVIASLLLILAKWINADVRTPQYFLQWPVSCLGFCRSS